MADANQQSKTELLAVQLDAVPETGADPELIEQAAAELRRMHAENEQLRAGLMQPPGEQEPVAWMFHAGDIWKFRWHHFNRPMGDAALKYWNPLFTHPQPKREPLTDDQIDAIAESMPGGLDGFLKGWGWRQFARAIEAAHGIGSKE